MTIQKIIDQHDYLKGEGLTCSWANGEITPLVEDYKRLKQRVDQEQSDTDTRMRSIGLQPQKEIPTLYGSRP